MENNDYATKFVNDEIVKSAIDLSNKSKNSSSITRLDLNHLKKAFLFR